MPPSTHSFFSRSSRTNSQDEDDRSLLPRHERRLPSFSLQDLSPREHTSRSPAASPSPPPSFYRDTLNSNTISDGLGGYKDTETEGSVNGRERSKGSSSRGGIRSLDGGEDVERPRRKIQFSAPPPPIATSVLLPSSSPYPQAPNSSGITWAPESSSKTQGRGTGQRRTQSTITDPLLGLERRERAIQKELQVLLDAQSAGLIQGFGGHRDGASGSMNGDVSEAGSSTPTSRSALHTNPGSREGSRNGYGRKTGSGVVPVRQPRRKKIGLRGARRGLLGDMGELALVKDEEIAVLEGEMGRREEVLRQVRKWEERIEGARERLSGYSASGAQNGGGGEEAMEIAELRTEERAVENEIREVEDRLAQMRARREWLKERIREGVNRQEAMLSGYRGALREAENEVKQFLKRPPIPVSVVMGEEEGFMALPVGRRTLGMAGEWWSKELTQLELRKKETEKEKTALEEGAKMWKESIKIVNDFEDDLRQQMASGQSQGPELLEKQTSKMRAVIDKLSQTAKIAEEKRWNLLICAVGAELEAFKEGEGILKGALEMLSPLNMKNEHQGEHSEHSEHGEHGDNETQTSHTSNESLLNELNEAALEAEIEKEHERKIEIEREAARESSFRTAREDSEDDGPPVELLVDGAHHGGEDGDHDHDHGGVD